MDHETCCTGAGGNRCVDLNWDSENCGRCGNVCPTGTQCRMGVCEASGMDGGMPDAPPIMRDAPMMSGMCRPECRSDEMRCGTTCVARGGRGGMEDPSFRNCGTCGRACDPSKANRCGQFGGSTRCLCGDAPACGRPDEMCVRGSTGEFQCVRSDAPENCGSPPVACNPGEMCVGGRCVCGSLGRACMAGESCVTEGGSARCVNTQNDPMNCGRIGNACRPGEACEGGNCVCPGAGRRCMEGMLPGGGGLPVGVTPTCGEGSILQCIGGVGGPGLPGFRLCGE
ncbi:MAG: hypothetical protein N2515_07585, partial [Deltaproteobacteria bacterium]|nr:hypothetical protein [Deltaproteobacteria bacterium]